VLRTFHDSVSITSAVSYHIMNNQGSPALPLFDEIRVLARQVVHYVRVAECDPTRPITFVWRSSPLNHFAPAQQNWQAPCPEADPSKCIWPGRFLIFPRCRALPSTGGAVHGCFLRLPILLLQNCAVQRNAMRTDSRLITSDKHATQRGEKLRKTPSFNYESPALTAELQAPLLGQRLSRLGLGATPKAFGAALTAKLRARHLNLQQFTIHQTREAVSAKAGAPGRVQQQAAAGL